ncbi:hypothetical protein BV898_06350 [Hypsibius exemplaris]|uniref:Uncharacterized protein n=1 Tax=Hypsibius exemplaris TaxID=2072580 RepID=A0A1W0WWL3_HYPEX|nr:hypothetical protein BV898_06350 [Hypsibius exemplaris]
MQEFQFTVVVGWLTLVGIFFLLLLLLYRIRHRQAKSHTSRWRSDLGQAYILIYRDSNQVAGNANSHLQHVASTSLLLHNLEGDAPAATVLPMWDKKPPSYEEAVGGPIAPSLPQN